MNDNLQGPSLRDPSGPRAVGELGLFVSRLSTLRSARARRGGEDNIHLSVYWRGTQRQNNYKYPPPQQSPAQLCTKILTALCLLFIPISLISPTLSAQPNVGQTQTQRTVWVIQHRLKASPETRALVATIKPALEKNLKNTTQPHVVVASTNDLAVLLKEVRRPIPPCLDGSELCTSPTATILQSLDCTQLVHGTLSQNADQSLSLLLTVYDATGTTVDTRTITSPPPSQGGSSLEALLQNLLLQATGATSKVSAKITVTTTPSGATLRLNNNRIGRSPLTFSAPVGEHIIEANLDYHKTAVARVKIAPGEQKNVALNLPSSLSKVTIDTSPVPSTFLLNGKPLKAPLQTLSLYPGDYQIEVRSPNYKTRFVQVNVGKEEQKNISLTLEPDRPSLNLKGLGDVPDDAILARPLFVRASFRYARLLTGLSAAKGNLDGQDVTTKDIITDNPNPPDTPAFNFYGLSADIGYTWEYLGLIAVGVTYTTSPDSTEDGAITYASSSIPATFRDLTHFEVTPLQLMFRYPYENLFPTIQTGFGYAYTAFVADTEQGAAHMRQDAYFWHFDIEATYFFDTWWYGYASIGLQRDLSHDDTKTNQSVSVGFGTTFEFPSFSSSSSMPPKQTP